MANLRRARRKPLKHRRQEAEAARADALVSRLATLVPTAGETPEGRVIREYAAGHTTNEVFIMIDAAQQLTEIVRALGLASVSSLRAHAELLPEDQWQAALAWCGSEELLTIDGYGLITPGTGE